MPAAVPLTAPRKPGRGRVARARKAIRREPAVSLIDKITGRAKKAAGDLAGDPSLRREGRQEERKGEAKDELVREQEKTDTKAEEVANLERKPS